MLNKMNSPKANRLVGKIIIGIFSMLLLIALSSCSDDTDPKFRIHNERSDKANVQVQTTGGNTININDVEPGQTTAYQIASKGNIIATAVIQNASVSPTLTFFADNDERYTIVIKAGDLPTLSVYNE
ncbi:MAG: hypothetical protein K9J16_18705 [Melioribacteraceae bacterium]|nr:hypothetical protein [Melioribacteraceae bacterium]MCF8357105.1 hypothetical protein [Melioribacteraceae bacterium]MCF8396066.1 hypothetical protein [Melioribacteraceae bacterium]MCF8418965.1 hypothetical protein [Melioribacteraceae bacterium]